MILISEIAYGSVFFWALVSLPALMSVIFIIAVMHRSADNILREPGPGPGLRKNIVPSEAEREAIRDALAETGYAYDWAQNIFYSTQSPWQRKAGYCSLYDESAAVLGMVIDCEPVRFEYGGKRWLIEFWKGQYGLTVGGEIGIYSTSGPDLDIPGVFNGTFYFCASEENYLSMTYALFREGRVLFRRAAKHWWLTGFRLGEFANPSSLRMEASLTFRDAGMLRAFVGALRQAGYTDRELRHSANTALLTFTKPRARQPLSRRGLAGWAALRWDRHLVLRYRKLTRGLDNMYDILMKLKKESPYLYSLVTNVGRKRESFASLEKIKNYIKTAS